MPQLSSLLSHWNLTQAKLISKSVGASVYLAMRPDHSHVVLKLESEDQSAALALKLWNGVGAVHLLDRSSDVMLIEYCNGPSALEIYHQKGAAPALAALIEVHQKIHSQTQINVSNLDLPRLSDWLKILASRAHENIFYERAARLAIELTQQSQRLTLLHGDLHHGNVIYHEKRGWLAIDPKGVLGDPIFDVTNIFYNPESSSELLAHTYQIEQLALNLATALDEEAKRILQYAYVYGALSVAWMEQDGIDSSARLKIAKSIGNLLF